MYRILYERHISSTSIIFSFPPAHTSSNKHVRTLKAATTTYQRRKPKNNTEEKKKKKALISLSKKNLFVFF